MREYGVHPTSKMLKLLNHIYLGTIAEQTHSYPLLKSLFQKRMHTMRTLGWISAFGSIGALFSLIVPFFMIEHQRYDLEYLNRVSQNHTLPANSFQHRTSAHFIEINQRYLFLMSQEMKKNYEEISKERQSLN